MLSRALLAAAASTVVVGVAAGCGRERVPEAEPCVGWRGEIEQAVAAACAPCHLPAGAREPAGGYDLATYNGALGPGSDGEPNAIAGDRGSLLLAYLDPATADAVHAGLPGVGALGALAGEWVDGGLAHQCGALHAGGILNPADPAFHGALLRSLDWRFDVCAGCHGDAFDGGAAEAPCTGCHPRGPTDCSTCHGDGPTTGAHAAHAPAGLADLDACAVCHDVPARHDAPGHIVRADGTADGPPAEVVLSGLAAVATEPRYDPAAGACADVYCHGGGRGDVRASNTRPVWAAGAGEAACGTCHGIAPASHADDRCGACHPRVADDAARIVDAALHVDGAVALGRAGDACDSCHDTPADLAGNASPEVITVGAHASHLEGAHGLRGPIPCGDCHVEPAATGSPGHIDSAAPAEVFPGGAAFGGLAAAGGAAPAWDRGAATCADVYCHGGGTTRMADDTAPGLIREPAWTAVGADQAACGTCHGAPPEDGLHAADLELSDCRTCHPATVDGFGNILITDDPAGGRTSAHINGTVDL